MRNHSIAGCLCRGAARGALALLAAAPLAAAAGLLPGWGDSILYCRKPEGNVDLALRWLPADGVRLAVVGRQGGAVALHLTADRLTAADLGPDGTPAGPPRTTRLYPAPVLSAPRRRAELTLKLRDTDWTLYLNGELVGALAAPFEPPADLCLPDGNTLEMHDRPVFRPVPKEEFASDFMIEEGAPNELYPWRVEAGNWHIHTALQDALARPETNMERVQQAPLTPDKSPNFYSLKGGGLDAQKRPVESVLTTGYDFFDEYEYAAALQINQGEAGLVFYHRGEGVADFYAFTIDMGPGDERNGSLRLWRSRDGDRQVLARVGAPLFRDQWHRLLVQTVRDEVICRLDDVEVIRVRERLPPGGKVGLYALGPEEIRFDDVKLRALTQVPLRNAGEVAYQALFQDGTFIRPPAWFRAGTPEDAVELAPGRAGHDQILVVGRPHHRHTAFSATFAPAGETWSVGLICGFRSPDRPYYRFVMERDHGREAFRLERVRRGGIQTVDGWDRPVPPESGPARPRLMVDGTVPGRLNLLCDEVLVLMLPLDAPLEGASGLLVGPRTGTTVRDLQYAFERERFFEQEQKNQVFREDNFMRHWASPEGQWITGPEGTLWHKGDFFSDYSVRLPCIAGSELHAGAADGAAEGAMIVSVGKESIVLSVREPGAAEPVRYEHALRPPEGATAESLSYEFHHEGYWCWVSVDGAILARHRLTVPCPGTRCFVKGMGLAQMARSRVTRANVIDDFFNESPYRWTVNGGTWQIINRFQCTPSWSHMAGESADGMAALWYKMAFAGDLTLEFYAGTRHGWYDRCGDLNCTVMADTTSPGRGYTVTCTEYDYNLSQNWNTLYRNGEVMARSDKYTVPRRRAGSVRKYMDPLIAEGRPVHGAWYYIKLRKIGRRVEYYFDNEPVFATEDENVLNEGLVGIWTFIHSMTVAQVKITFQKAWPRPFPVWRLPRNQPPPAPAPAGESAPGPEATSAQTSTSAPAAPPVWPLTVGGFPVESLHAGLWSTTDTVGHALLEPLRISPAALRLENRLGSGNMLMKPTLPPVPLHRLAGWRFQVRRTPGACFNLYYTIGTAGADGTFTPLQACFHRITGCDFSDGAYRCTGQSAVPPTDRVDRPGGPWHTVTAWIPSAVRSPEDEGRGLAVRLDGFGNLQPSPVLCGLRGNVPGDGYVVRDLTPVFFGVPEPALGAEAGSLRVTVLDAPRGRLLGEASGDGLQPGLAELLKQVSKDGLNTVWLRVADGNGNVLSHSLAWVQLPAVPSVSLAWDPDCLDTLRLDLREGFPDPRLTAATVTLGETALPVEPVGNEEARRVRLPRGPARPTGEFAVTLALAGQTSAYRFGPAAQPRNPPPVLLAVEGLKSFCSTFEGPEPAPLAFSNDGRMAILHDDPVQGRFLQVRNRDLEQRLATPFNLGFSIAEFPLLQMRYRAFDMTHASIAFANYHYIRLNDDLPGAVPVRLAQDLVLDEAWHTWTGVVADGFNQKPFAVNRFTPQSMTLGSAGSPDQTGRYSRWHLDDVVFGPAVSRPEQLAFVPRYEDSDGVGTVLAAISAGGTAYADFDAERRGALVWQPCEPGKPLALSFEGLADGPHHLLLRAVDTRGAESAVTDIPFLLDTRPLEVAASFGALADPASNGVALNVVFENHGGAPWAIEKASFFVAGDALPKVPAWTSLFDHSPERDVLTLNYPLICRTYLNKASDGETIEFAIDGIADGAGNASPRLAVPIKVDHAADKTGPAWYYLQFESSVHWWWNWDGYRNASQAFSAGQYNQAGVVHNAGESPYLQHLTYYATGDLSRAVTWNPNVHPWLSFRMRLPAFRPNRPPQLHMILATTDGRVYSISLTAPGTADTELNRTRQIQWDPGKWNRLAFNVRDLMKAAGLTDEALGKTVIASVTVQRRGTHHQEPLFLDDFFIHGPAAEPSKPDPLQWYAYDASGVASLQVECVADDDQVQWTEELPLTGADLNTLRGKLPGPHAWLRCSARDKAGNLSVPFWLPLAR